MDDVITIAGRAFRPVVETTIEHDLWTMERIRRAGLTEMILKPGEDPEDYSRRLLYRLIESGAAMEMLAGFLVPAEIDPLDWTPAIALESASIFRRASKPEDKATIQAKLIDLLLDFLQAGIVSARITERFSPRVEAATRPKTEDITISGSGERLSDRSADTIRAASRQLSANGRSGKSCWRIWPFSGRKRGSNTGPTA